MKWKDLVKIGISGSRKFQNPKLCTKFMDEYVKKYYESYDNIVLITGGAAGVDTQVEIHCIINEIMCLRLPAKWHPNGNKGDVDRSAGVIRNRKLVELSTEVICFWDERSPGTKHTINIANEMGKPLQVFTEKYINRKYGVVFSTKEKGSTKENITKPSKNFKWMR